MSYFRVPSQVSIYDLKKNDFSLSPSLYQRVEIPSSEQRRIGDLIQDPIKGEDPGSAYYLKRSTAYLIRTKALQDHSLMVYPKGEAIIPVSPRALKEMELLVGDILLSKDSNIGECAMVWGSPIKSHGLSGGVLRVRPLRSVNKFYLFSFMKHPLFKDQLEGMVPRGSTIRHAKNLWLDCKIPFPTSGDRSEIESVIEYVAALMEAALNKELMIRRRNDSINSLISDELLSSQKPGTFVYQYPNLKNINDLGRFDAAIYGAEYKSKIWPIRNYLHGYETPAQAGFSVTPGPSLEIKLLGTRIDSQVSKPGFYELYIPANMSEWGTMTKVTWLGTKRRLTPILKGDVLIGEAGFQKGRSVVFIDQPNNGTTNAHGLIVRREDQNLQQSVFFRCIFNWYRSNGLIDLMAVGGSGGHFSPEYFDFVLIPNFSADLRERISTLYYSSKAINEVCPRTRDFVAWHQERDQALGIWELDQELRTIQRKLKVVHDQIIAGDKVSFDES